MFEVLMFLFENYMDTTAFLKADNQTLVLELEKAGFSRSEIDKALDWLDGLVYFQSAVESVPMTVSHSMRHFLTEEREQLGVDGQGFLIFLEQLGILDPITREIVIDRLMALDRIEVDLERIKWVVLMALFNQPEKKAALSLLQDMVLQDTFGVKH